LIDIHAHLLPGVDDGPRDWDEAIALIKQGIEDGIKAAVVSPHTLNGAYITTDKEVEGKLQELRERIGEEGLPPLNLYPGTELYLVSNPVEEIKKGRALPINQGSYVVIELPSTQVPPFVDDIFFRMRLQGYQAVINHPERNTVFQKNMAALGSLVDNGALTIITAGSVTGLFGSVVQRAALSIIEKGWGHCIATDAHHPDWRPMVLSKAYRGVEGRFGEDAAKRLFHDNPLKVIQGDKV